MSTLNEDLIKLYHKEIKDNTLYNILVECPKCRGKGMVVDFGMSNYGLTQFERQCYKCKGTGKVDWVKRITKT